MKEYLVSIIVPVYNSEKYLRECLDSIIRQEYKYFEVILIDDGSSDQSGKICDEYALNDTRFMVYHIPNGGVSNARNFGLSKARGTYVTFVDSDDFISSNFLMSLIVNVDSRFDLVLSGLSYFNGENPIILIERLSKQEFHLSENRLDAFELARFKLITSPCCKLYKRSLILNNCLQFNTSMSFAEDRDFNLHYLQYVQHAISLPYVGYSYRRGISTSLSQDKDYEKLLSIDLDYWQKLYNFLQKRDCLSEAKPYLANRLYHFYNDRLSQIISSRCLTIMQTYSFFKSIANTTTFSWLIQHINLVHSSTLIYYTYRYKLLFFSSLLYCKQK